MARFPQVLLNVRVEHPARWQEVPAITGAIETACAQLGGDGRVLVRASGTEPLVRVMLEGRDETVIRAVAQSLADLIALELSGATALV